MTTNRKNDDKVPTLSLTKKTSTFARPSKHFYGPSWNQSMYQYRLETTNSYTLHIQSLKSNAK